MPYVDEEKLAKLDAEWKAGKSFVERIDVGRGTTLWLYTEVFVVNVYRDSEERRPSIVIGHKPVRKMVVEVTKGTHFSREVFDNVPDAVASFNKVMDEHAISIALRALGLS